MMPVLKTILNRLEKIEKQLKVKEKKEEEESKDLSKTKVLDREIFSQKIEEKPQRIIDQARQEAEKIRSQAEEKAQFITSEALSVERRLLEKEEKIDERIMDLNRQRNMLNKREDEIEEKQTQIEKLRGQLITKLEKVANLTREEAKSLILKSLEERLKSEIAKKIKEVEETAKLEAEKRAREILVDAMKHGATDYVAEYTVSTIKIPDEDIKGRIIGKEGRNIRAFEMATGVDVDLDEEGVIRLSSFDPARREIARVALEKLIRDGRIQPVRIEELVKQTKKEIEKLMFNEGEKLCHKVGVYNMPTDKIALLGRFKYRFSYGQNMIAHTLEETKIGVALAHELGADVNTVRIGCLLHDIGKVISDKEGSHVELGVDLLKKNGMPKQIIDCVAAHHEDIPFPSIEAVIVYITDAISGARPGARSEDISEYVKRLKKLEDIATSFTGIKKAYALTAGRELRVIVDPGKLDDAETTVTVDKIAQKIEEEFPTFPGQIKITIIRELRVSKTVH